MAETAARWQEFAAEAPGLAEAARDLLAARRHLTLATLRRDGAPRISGIEVIFRDGDLWLGMMWRSAKALDLRRDPRFALHSGSTDPPGWAGDATVSGLVEEIHDQERVRAVIGDQAPPGPARLFRARLREAMVVRLGDPPDHLVVEVWNPGRGTRRMTRR